MTPERDAVTRARVDVLRAVERALVSLTPRRDYSGIKTALDAYRAALLAEVVAVVEKLPAKPEEESHYCVGECETCQTLLCNEAYNAARTEDLTAIRALTEAK